MKNAQKTNDRYLMLLERIIKDEIFMFSNPEYMKMCASNSVAGSCLRNFLVNPLQIKAIVNLQHYQPFNASTYTMIMVISKGSRCNSVSYYEYDAVNLNPVFINQLHPREFFINEKYYFCKREKLISLRRILSNKRTSHFVCVKNGFATLLDEFFIGDWKFDQFVIPVVKASTSYESKCIYPYNRSGELIPFSTLEKSKEIKEYYLLFEDKLKSRSIQRGSQWYGFGRTQGILDVYKNKYAIGSLLRGVHDIKIAKCPRGTGVYGGLYILTEKSQDEIEFILNDN